MEGRELARQGEDGYAATGRKSKRNRNLRGGGEGSVRLVVSTSIEKVGTGRRRCRFAGREWGKRGEGRGDWASERESADREAAERYRNEQVNAARVCT